MNSPVEGGSGSGPGLSVWVLTAALLALDAALPAFHRDLWNPDEPRLAHLAQGMLRDGGERWLLPRVNGELFLEQPPLQAWLVSASLWLAGGRRGPWPDWAPRVPSMILALATLALVARAGERHFGRGAGWLAAALLATTVQFYITFQRAVVDVSLVFLVTLAMLQWLEALSGDRPVGLGWRPAATLGVAIGLAFLAKNLIGPVFIALAGGALGLRHPGALLGRHALPRLGLAAIIAVAVPLPYLLAVAARDPAALEILLWDNTAGRFFSAGKHNPPLWDFLHRGLWALGPWLPFAALFFWDRLRRSQAQKGGGERARSVAAALLAWLLLPWLLVLASGSKREIYLAPLAPAVALAAAAWIWERRMQRATANVARVVGSAAAAAVALAALVGEAWAAPLPNAVWVYLVVAFALIHRGWQRLREERRLGAPSGGETRLMASALLALSALGAASLVVFPEVNRRESYVPLAEELRRRRAEGLAVVGVDLALRERSAIPWYLGEDIPAIATAELGTWVAPEAPPAVLVCPGKLPESAAGLVSGGRFEVRRDPIYLVLNRAAAAKQRSPSQ
jgi:4-amino-4-deoxy-L-arabinose transferase-like glycosyltransferase